MVFLLSYTCAIPPGMRAWSPGSQGAASRAPLGVSGFFFFSRAARARLQVLAGRAGLPKGGAGSLTRSTNLHGLPPSLGRVGGRYQASRQGVHHG